MNIFADNAIDLLRAGLAVVPLAPGHDKDLGERAGKKPEFTNYNRWRGRPSSQTVEQWCTRFPSHNVGYIPGLSGIVAVDDDGGAAEQIQEIFGKTPGRIRAQRGSHYLYRAPRTPMPTNFELRRFGINADLKFGNNAIAVAPPSAHRTGHVYSWDACDASVLKDLPPFPVDALQALVDRRAPASQAELKVRAGFRGGSRRLQLNDSLCRHTVFCDSFDELLDVAKTWNDGLPELGIEKLPDTEVAQIARAVWRDLESGKLERWHGRSPTIRTTLAELLHLLEYGQHGASAIALLMALRAYHGARSEPFAINQIAMADAGTIPGYSRQRIEKARAILLEAGRIKIVAQGQNSASGRTSTLYRLVEHPKQ